MRRRKEEQQSGLEICAFLPIRVCNGRPNGFALKNTAAAEGSRGLFAGWARHQWKQWAKAMSYEERRPQMARNFQTMTPKAQQTMEHQQAKDKTNSSEWKVAQPWNQSREQPTTADETTNSPKALGAVLQ